MTTPQLPPMPVLDRVPAKPSRSTLGTRDVNSYFRSIPPCPSATVRPLPRLTSAGSLPAFFPVPGASI